VGKYPESIGVVADLHCGSRWGLFPPRWSNVRQNVGQRYLWRWWLWHVEKWKEILGGKPLDLLVVNGDLIEGKQPRSRSTGLVTADLQEQAEIGALCLKPLVDALRPRKRVRTTGTDYHEGPDNPLPSVDEKFGFRVVDELNVNLERGVLQAQHNPGSCGAIYKGTIIDREILWSVIAAALQKAPDATFIVRSHLHYFHMMQTHSKTFILTPCWQLQTRYARKNRYRWTPDVGAVLLVRDDTAYGGYRVHVKQVPLPSYERKAVDYATL